MASPSGPSPTPRRVFGRGGEPDSSPESTRRQSNTGTLRPGRISFSLPRPNIGRWRGTDSDAEAGDNSVTSPSGDKPPIPSALQSAAEVNATPLPTLSMLVLSITLLGEFLTANVSMPFILFMVEGFSEFKDDDEADVGFWTGILVSTFFLTQFVTSLLWATVADKHGARLVLTVALFGGSLSCALFGTSTSLRQAICVRLVQGIFAGAIGVARGCVTVITDPSNEGRAYAILGFCWGFGGAAGAIIGGLFESPATKWPGVFSDVALFTTYPYLLPTLVAASVTFFGGILSFFLGPDGGPRGGAIRLPIEKDDPASASAPGANVPSTIPEDATAPPSPVLSPTEPRGPLGGLRRVSRKLSGYFGGSPAPEASPAPTPVPMPSRGMRRTSRANGSAYGYSIGAGTPVARTASFRARLASGASARRPSIVPGSSLRARGSVGAFDRDSRPSFGGGGTGGEDLNFAQRLLMANENAVTNIADLWVAAAMNVDNEEVFESDDEDGEDGIGVGAGDDMPVFDWDSEGTPAREDTPSRPGGSRLNPAYGSLQGSPGARRASGFAARRPSRGTLTDAGGTLRRASGAPSIFAHPGVRTPQAVVDAHKLLESEDPFAEPVVPEAADEIQPPQQGVWSQLPLLIIIQYGLLALHTTTHDMVFLSYLVSKYESGGLNLNASHFSQLTALMCLFQVAYQFYLYPNIGPPRGRFSHLSMFRIGTLLFIPGYVTVTLYRVFASADDDGNAILMTALAVSAAVRYCGSTFGYTSISILLNYMSPPPLVGLANGIGQSIVSLARFFGPILGGYIWSMSVERNPTGFWIPFFICGAICAVGLAHSFFIR
ncbi:unnamed protein product [Peniophora sp. CBMAI 1063]|nr:unnamed protein product [Peniophora sp. CBMAI 1063]